MTSLDEAVQQACDEAGDVLDAFVYMAIWEVNRSTDGSTCFRIAFEAVTKEWQRRKAVVV